LTHAVPSRRAARARSDYDQLRAGGRWARLLTELGKGPADVTELLQATDQGKYPLWRERRKIRTALFDMGNLGWVEATAWGWARTRAGTEAFASIDDRHPCGGRD
jgi:hypothetical protein